MIANPLARTERISIIDALRGVALLGILLMNMPFFAADYRLDDNPFVGSDMLGLNRVCWWVVKVLFDGSMRGIFSLLFGAGSFLLISRLDLKNAGLLPADIFFRRLLYLISFGLIDSYVFLWSGDILWEYGVAGLLFFPFRQLKPRALLGFAAFFIVVASIAGTVNIRDSAGTRRAGVAAATLKAQKKPLTAEQNNQLAAWHTYQNQHNLDTLRYNAAKDEAKLRTQSYPELVASSAEVNIYLLSNWHLANGLWESLGFMMLGLALFKWGVLQGQRSTGFYLRMAAIGYAVGLPIRILYFQYMLANGFDGSLMADFLPFNFYQVPRIAITLGHVCLLISLYKAGWMRGAFRALARVGQMAFTNYLSHSILCAVIFYGFDYFGRFQRYEYYLVAASIWTFQLIFSSVWLRYYQFGPLEWVWRSLTYWSLQPMRRNALVLAEV
jgi:uncharacterized protein